MFSEDIFARRGLVRTFPSRRTTVGRVRPTPNPTPSRGGSTTVEIAQLRRALLVRTRDMITSLSPKADQLV